MQLSLSINLKKPLKLIKLNNFNKLTFSVFMIQVLNNSKLFNYFD